MSASRLSDTRETHAARDRLAITWPCCATSAKRPWRSNRLLAHSWSDAHIQHLELLLIEGADVFGYDARSVTHPIEVIVAHRSFLEERELALAKYKLGCVLCIQRRALSWMYRIDGPIVRAGIR